MNGETPIVLTKHVFERYRQRFAKGKFRHIEQCERGGYYCWKCQAEEIELEAVIRRKLEDADVVKSYLNNTNFMSNIFEKYGYDRKFEIRVDKNIVFVIILEESQKVVVTCYEAEGSIVKQKNVKYKRKQKEQPIRNLRGVSKAIAYQS